MGKLGDFHTRRVKIVLVGSMVSSLSLLSRCEPDAALHQPSCPIFDELSAAFGCFYFSLYFNDKRKKAVCDVHFVPNIQGRAERDEVSISTAAKRALT